MQSMQKWSFLAWNIQTTNHASSDARSDQACTYSMRTKHNGIMSPRSTSLDLVLKQTNCLSESRALTVNIDY